MLNERIAWITGAGSGLGRAIALRFAKEGACIVAGDLNERAAAETIAQLGSTGKHMAQRVDITDANACHDSAGRIVERFGRIDILVNCAALCLVDPLLEVTPERWDKVFAVNVRGAFFVMQAAARAMLARKFGRIIHISSPASKLGFPNFASYAASKAALDSLVRSAAVGWAEGGITVNTIAPGRMTGGMIDELERELQRVTGKSAEELKNDRTKNLPMGRRVEPAEVASAAVWLASNEAAYVTAERFNFSGGMELS
jgi:NAD(P)-dependent dehydrogenase (short-subunit alcohol dehydrogenase family)